MAHKDLAQPLAAHRTALGLCGPEPASQALTGYSSLSLKSSLVRHNDATLHLSGSLGRPVGSVILELLALVSLMRPQPPPLLVCRRQPQKTLVSSRNSLEGMEQADELAWPIHTCKHTLARTMDDGLTNTDRSHSIG